MTVTATVMVICFEGNVLNMICRSPIQCLPNRNKTSWMHPRSEHRNIIDYVIVRRTDRHIFRVTKTMCCADCWTNHRLVVRKLELRIQQPARRPQGKKAPERLDVPKLNQDSMGQAFNNDICNHLGAMNLSS